ncbi:hypothetical protein VUR80DRAFT_5992 [Thermomyces stellatus]
MRVRCSLWRNQLNPACERGAAEHQCVGSSRECASLWLSRLLRGRWSWRNSLDTGTNKCQPESVPAWASLAHVRANRVPHSSRETCLTVETASRMRRVRTTRVQEHRIPSASLSMMVNHVGGHGRPWRLLLDGTAYMNRLSGANPRAYRTAQSQNALADH